MRHVLTISDENKGEWQEEYDIPDGIDPMAWGQELVEKYNAVAQMRKEPIRALLSVAPSDKPIKQAKDELVVVCVEWGRGFYKDGELVDYQKNKNGDMDIPRLAKLSANCTVREEEMYDAAWEYSGEGFPELLEDALNPDYDPHA